MFRGERVCSLTICEKLAKPAALTSRSRFAEPLNVSENFPSVSVVVLDSIRGPEKSFTSALTIAAPSESVTVPEIDWAKDAPAIKRQKTAEKINRTYPF